ncbi:MAG: DUF2064 domain-containing protein [Deltaproteobacteria bacterium]|nr:DUF2064 domain-containing protein [Deltaproteobacteria bacterium]
MPRGVTIGVLARAPLPGACKKRLLAAHPPAWVSGLYAAMLRDTIDGLQSVTADEYLVFAAPLDGDAGEAAARSSVEVLARHVPAPWEVIAQEVDDPGARMEHALSVMFERGASYGVLAGADAPSAPTEPLEAALADDEKRAGVLVAPSEDGGYYAIGMPRLEPSLVRDMPWSTPALMETTRLRCKSAGLALVELPKWYDVDQPSDVLALIDELRRHPERAPRTAQFIVTSG